MKALPGITFAALMALQAAAQTPPDPELQEQYELSQAVNDAGTSPIDMIRALEAHLKKYPATKQLARIDQTLAKSAMDLNDNPRIILYGEKVLRSGTQDDLVLIDRLVRVLVGSTDPEQQKQALEFAKRYENDVIARGTQTPPGHLTAGQWSDEIDRARAIALALEARATGDLAGPEEGAKMALKSWELYPTGEGARELAYWQIKLQQTRAAIESYANAFTLGDPRTTEADRARDRRELGELYAKLNGSEKGLGDVLLEAYDRTTALLAERREALKEKDPNAVAANFADFVLPPVEKSDAPLVLSSLKGKTVVIEFWATWCAPCRAQHPLIEKIRKRFEDEKDIVFIPVNADEDPSLVAPFLKEQGWEPGYLEAGLAQKMVISSIPTVLVLDPAGRIYSRITGFVPERFEQMLTQRIEDARASK
jgi:thiol-disulfide isomerase/thioredoxin